MRFILTIAALLLTAGLALAQTNVPLTATPDRVSGAKFACTESQHACVARGGTLDNGACVPPANGLTACSNANALSYVQEAFDGWADSWEVQRLRTEGATAADLEARLRALRKSDLTSFCAAVTAMGYSAAQLAAWGCP